MFFRLSSNDIRVGLRNKVEQSKEAPENKLQHIWVLNEYGFEANVNVKVARILFGVPWTFKMWLGANIMDV